MISVPLRTGNGMNSREHHMARARRVKREREAAAWMLKRAEKPILPCVVLLTRSAPSNGLDRDNLQGALKAVRDQVAEWLEVDDRDESSVRYEYAQIRGPWAVSFEFKDVDSQQLHTMVKDWQR